MAYTVTFWGVRGSIPTPGPSTARYGGNTPCLSVENLGSGGGRYLILDAGTGIRELGNKLAQRANGALEIDLLISHTHWDHIQGLPFFSPFFAEGNAIRIMGPKQGEVNLKGILRGQMKKEVFPVPLDGLSAELNVEHVNAAEFPVGGFIVRSVRLRHPAPTLGYRLTPEGGGPSLAYVTDNELGSGGDYDVAPTWRQDLVRFLDGADVLVHDAMYTPEQIEQYRGWGHSSYAEAVELAGEAGVSSLVLFHHLPEHDDAAMDILVEKAQQAADAMQHPLEVSAAAEGVQLTL